MRRYELQEIVPINLKPAPHIKGDYLMSPYVWVQGDTHWMALRVVDVDAKGVAGKSIVSFARGDGVNFQLADVPALGPGPTAEDRDGCEDPTLFFHEGRCKLYYTGWNAEVHQSRLLFASGRDIQSLQKHGDVMHYIHHWNLKEATIVQGPEDWKIFYEYSDSQHSLIGCASSDTPDGRWREDKDPFGLRPDHWDSWHLSTGPIAFQKSDAPVMFYNGADAQARWRIGWVEFDPTYHTVTRRCDEALIRPEHLPDGFPDIAFVASSLELGDGIIELYISIADRRLCKAIVKVREAAS